MGFWDSLLKLGKGSQGATAESYRGARRPSPSYPDLKADPARRLVALDEGLQAVAEFGFTPRRPITVADVPFDSVGGVDRFLAERTLTLLTLTDDDGPLFNRAAAFDYESIISNDAYARIVEDLATAAGTRGEFAGIFCDLHYGPRFAEDPRGELVFTRADTEYEFRISSEGNWADPEVVAQLFSLVAPAKHSVVTTRDGEMVFWVPKSLASEFSQVLDKEQDIREARLREWTENH